jgi:RNA polymerase sigma-70 factor (ECF subfamily)
MGVEQEKKDEELVAMVQNGDSDSFGPLIERYEQRLIRYARRFLFDSDEVKDIVQEVFIKAYMNIKSFNVSQKFSPWIYRIAHNQFINEIKKKQGRFSVPLFEFDTMFPHLVATETTESMSMQKEQAEEMEGILQMIDQKYREILVLYYWEDLDYRSIANIVGIPVSTVGVRLNRAKAMIKKIVEQRGIKNTKHASSKKISVTYGTEQ